MHTQTPTTPLDDALSRLYARRTFGVKLGLEAELALLNELGDPHGGMPVVHVAGTNGKGSVCALLDAVLVEAGLSTGLYTSPHLVRFHERFRTNGENITDTKLKPLIECTERAADLVASKLGQQPTFFECATAMAFQLFKQENVDVAIIETGLGGRLDATNIASPIVSVITRVGIDHVKHLGTGLTEIAAEKCGIIKPEKPVVCGPQDPEVMAVIETTAQQKHCLLAQVEERVAVTLKNRDLEGQSIAIETADARYGAIHFPLHGDHQLENLAIAVAVIEELSHQELVNISPNVLKAGIRKINWPGRCQVMNRGPIVVLDGAHNVSAAEQLAKSLKYLVGHVPIGLVCGFCGDRDVRSFFECLPKTIKKVWIVPVKSSRNRPTEHVREAARSRRWEIVEGTLPDALTEATSWAQGQDGAVCVTGSLYLAGEMLALEEGKVASSE